MEAISVGSPGLKPPLKWVGGKRWLVRHLRPFWEQHSEKRLVEPLCGSLAISLGLMPAQALLNDKNPHLVNFFRWVQRGLIIGLPMENDKDLYYAYRDSFNRLIDEGGENSKEAAELFYYLNRTGYNGLCRFNRKGKFNVPFGRYKKINYCSDFTPYRALFEAWHFTTLCYEELLLKNDDFIYADPPYDVEFTAYTGAGFGWDDQVRLAKWLARHSGPVLLSNQATDRIVALYGNLGFKLTFLQAPRMINCTGDRTPAREVLAMKGL